ncbi:MULTISPECIES: hypothetical protein [Clostridia]|jgi:hypothetical protein|nr:MULTISPECIES: hypothetical protein [Clostridia]
MKNENAKQKDAAEMRILLKTVEILCREKLISVAGRIRAENQIYRRYRL